MLSPFSYVRPESLEEAVKQLASDPSVIHAGGTDLLTCLRENLFQANKVVSLSGLAELRGVSKTTDGGLRIGALTTLTEIANDPSIKELYTALSRGAAEAASPQLRNQGTVGGNICQKPRCWYYRGDFHCLRKGGNECFAVGAENAFHCIYGGENCYYVHPSDTAPNLAALGASARVFGPKGERIVPLDAFHVLPRDDYTKETVLEQGEIVTDIVLPAPASGLRSSYRKVRARGAWDFAVAGVALAMVLKEDVVESARIFLSGAAPVPWRAKDAEIVLTGSKLDAATIELASGAAVKNAVPMEQNGYKIPLFKAVVAEELQKMAANSKI